MMINWRRCGGVNNGGGLLCNHPHLRVCTIMFVHPPTTTAIIILPHSSLLFGHSHATSTAKSYGTDFQPSKSGAKFAQSNVHYRLSDFIFTYIVGDDLAT